MIQGSKKPRLPSRETVLYGILTLVVALGVLQTTALLGLTLFRQFETNAQIGTEQKRVNTLQNEFSDLKTRFEQAKTDPVYLELAARNLGFIKKGERVIIPKTPTVTLHPVKPK